MKQNAKIALCGMIAALSVLFMLLAYFPYFTYAAPAVTGLLIMLLVIEIDVKWAAGAYIAASVLIFFFAEPEAKLMYICLFGHYPILKALIERINKPVAEWVLKIAVFNASALVAYGLLYLITDISFEDFGALGTYGAWIVLALGNIVFAVYDIAIGRMSVFYMSRLHRRVSRLFKN